MKNEYDTKSLLLTVITLIVFLGLLTLYIVFHDAQYSSLPSWIKWFL